MLVFNKEQRAMTTGFKFDNFTSFRDHYFDVTVDRYTKTSIVIQHPFCLNSNN